MQKLIYYILLPLIYLVSWLPYPILYLLSDFLFLIVYTITGYRKKVVIENLSNSFPDKSEDEIQEIAKKYYSYLCDMIVEVFKNFTISPEEATKRCKFKDTSIFDRYYANNQSIVVVMGHLGNWELSGLSMAVTHPYKLQVLYHPLNNPDFDNLIHKMRSRFGTKLIAMNNTFREMVNSRNQVTATVFIADQTPHAPHTSYWTMFLNQETAIFEGTEKIARKMNYPVVYAAVKRVKRGYYEVHLETLVEHSADTSFGEISELHTRKLEQDIIEQPETWLWSHRRWKHKGTHFYKAQLQKMGKL
jgi:KDO2-lipid IV(A) lauroyltransferase